METIEKTREQTEETCPHCAAERREEGLEPNRLIRLNPTMYQLFEVLVCPTCDGIT